MKQEPLPRIHFLHDADLMEFIYGLHILAGDFLRESEFNMRSFVTNTGADSIAIMGRKHMWLSDALFAYCPTADLYQMAFTTEYLGARAFLLHTDRTEKGHLYGDVLMMDLDTLRQDVKGSTLCPYGVSIEDQDGIKSVIGLDKWNAMQIYEKSELKSWGFYYDSEPVTKWRQHYSNMFSQWKEQGVSYKVQDLEERLNMEYMEGAQNPSMDMCRIPMETAKQMLLYDEAPIYRLLPSGPEKIPPITAVTTGLWYECYREFAVSFQDFDSVDRLIHRETDRIIGRHPMHHVAERKRSDQER